ncbi:MAG: HEAT repeat domain-containing protein [Anaerolineales bacterium]|nr:MAG: HEAT repeat domain-containing protein [Anaerolineales bacterium]
MREVALLLDELLSGDEQRAERAARQLSAWGEQALSALRDLLDGTTGDDRWWVVRALAEFSGEAAAALLVQALKERDPAIRHCAALGLQRNPSSNAVPKLVELMQDGDSLMLRLAANALVATGAPAVPDLLKLLEGEASPAQLEAARALALIGDTRAIPALFAACERDSALLEYWAGEGLERMGVGMVFFQP